MQDERAQGGLANGHADAPMAGEERWLAEVDKALKGLSRDRLTRTTEDGALIAPLYKREAGAVSRQLRPVQMPWTITTRIDLTDATAANHQLLDDLQGGAGGMSLVAASGRDPRGHGLPDLSAQTLEKVLQDVLLDLVEIRLEMDEEPVAALQAMAALVRQRGHEVNDVSVSLAIDPVGAGAVAGLSRAAAKEGVSAQSLIAGLVSARSELGLHWPVISCDGRLWHDQGATGAQELGLVFATCLATFRSFETAGLMVEDWPAAVTVTLAAGADQQETLAKARAARMLWARILDVCGLPQEPLKLHMESSWRMLTRRDPFVNLLRNTVAGFAAAVGGADSLCLLPHTQALGLPDAFARRLARNTQSILLEESHLAQVADPAAGSGALESRTRGLVDASWSVLQSVEAQGDFSSAGTSNLIADMLAQARNHRLERLSRVADPLIGVSSYPNLAEVPVKVLAPAPDLSDLPFARDAAPFETLRDAAEECGAGDAAHVFLAPLGRLAQFSARAAFATNAFAAGGLRTTVPAEQADLASVAANFKASGCSMACLVGPDPLYQEKAVDLVAALKQAGATHVYLAGRPGDQAEALKAAGLDTALYAGCDLLSCLREAHARLGWADLNKEAAQ